MRRDKAGSLGLGFVTGQQALRLDLRQQPMVWLFRCGQKRLFAQVLHAVKFAGIVEARWVHDFQTFLNRRKERAAGFQLIGQRFQPFGRQVAKRFEIIGNQPFFSFDIATVGPLEQRLPPPKHLEKLPFALDFISQGGRVLRQLLLQGCYGGREDLC